MNEVKALTFLQVYNNKKCFRNIYAPLAAKFKITTYMYKALWIQNFVQGRTKRLHSHDQIAKKLKFLNH